MRTMKDSGIEWIGEIPLEWKTARIKYVIDRSEFGIKIGPFGSTLSNRTLISGPYKVYSQANLISNSFSDTNHYIDRDTFADLHGYEVKPGDICVSMMGTIGKCKAVPEGISEGIMDSHLIKIRLDETQIEPRFFEYVYDKDNSGVCFTQMQYEKKGTIMDGLNTAIVKNLVISLPPLTDQIKISDYLDTKCSEIDALIAAKEKTNALLKEWRQSIIYEAVTKGLNPYVPMKDSGIELIGGIPEEWDVIRLKYLLSSGKDSMKAGPFGSSLTSSDMQGSDVKVFTQRTVLDNDFENGNEAVSVEKSQELKGFIAEEGDILITTRGTIGKTAIVPEGKRGVIHPCLIKMQIDEGKFSKKLLCKIFNETSILSEQLRIASNATTIDVVYTQNLMNMFIPIASIKEQKRIDEYLTSECSTIDRLISTNNTEISKLKEYRQSLIYEAVTGKIEV